MNYQASYKDTTGMPELYARWIDEILQGQIPEETEATCLDCAMCDGKKIERTKSDQRFHPDTKCCTVFPRIPNFHVGNILLDQDPSAAAGRLRFLSQFHIYTLVTPLGVFPPPADHARYGAMTDSFGHNRELRCPYFIDESGGLCGIWKFRNAQCSTWFCKHVRGQTGLYFWRALNDVLQQVEDILSVWCIHELKAGDEDFRKLFPLGEAELQTFQKQSQFNYRMSRAAGGEPAVQAWGSWYGHERKFFEECAKLTQALTWNSISKLGGSRLERAIFFLKSCYSDLTTFEVPKIIKAGKFRSLPVNENTVRLWGYSQYDPIDVPLDIFNAIESMNVPEEWVRKLCDFGILV